MNALSQQDQQKLEHYKGPSVGQVLRKTREAQSITVAQVSTHLNIGTAHIEAIEADHVEALPQRVYAIGFVRAYADAMGLDSEKIVYLFKRQTYGRGAEGEENRTTPQSRRLARQENVFDKVADSPKIGRWIIRFAIILFIGGFVYWLLSGGVPRDDAASIPAVPAEMQKAQVTPTELLVTSEEEALPQPMEPTDLIVKPEEGANAYGSDPLQSPLVLKMTAATAIEVRKLEGGAVLFKKAINAGDVYYIGGHDTVLISALNGGAVEVYLDGRKIGVLGQEGEEIRFRPLSVEALRLKE